MSFPAVAAVEQREAAGVFQMVEDIALMPTGEMMSDAKQYQSTDMVCCKRTPPPSGICSFLQQCFHLDEAAAEKMGDVIDDLEYWRKRMKIFRSFGQTTKIAQMMIDHFDEETIA